MGIPFTIKIIRNEEGKMKKFASAGLSILVATGVVCLIYQFSQPCNF